MSEQNTKSAAEGMGDIMHFWFDMASQAAKTGRMWDSQVTPEAMHETRNDLFKSWSNTWERFLRSAYFLDTEKNFVGGGAEMRKQFNDFLGRMHHEMQIATSQDVDRIMLTLRRMQEDLSEQYEQVSSQLKDLTARLDVFARRMDALETEQPAKERIQTAHRRKQKLSRTLSAAAKPQKITSPKIRRERKDK